MDFPSAGCPELGLGVVDSMHVAFAPPDNPSSWSGVVRMVFGEVLIMNGLGLPVRTTCWGTRCHSGIPYRPEGLFACLSRPLNRDEKCRIPPEMLLSSHHLESEKHFPLHTEGVGAVRESRLQTTGKKSAGKKSTGKKSTGRLPARRRDGSRQGVAPFSSAEALPPNASLDLESFSPPQYLSPARRPFHQSTIFSTRRFCSWRDLRR